MTDTDNGKRAGAIFITFPGNCRKALTCYQTCFGGTLQFETFEEELAGYTGRPVVSGSLVSDSIIIHGSDLVHNEGRMLGNYMSIFLHCRSAEERRSLIAKLKFDQPYLPAGTRDDQRLVEITDAFDVRWVLGI